MASTAMLQTARAPLGVSGLLDAAAAALAIQRALAELNRKNARYWKAGACGAHRGGLHRAKFSATCRNIAARAQALAEPVAVVVTARVQRQVAGLFVADERGNHELKGVPEPVTLFRLVRAAPSHPTRGSLKEEIATLMRRWGPARQYVV